MRWWSKLRNRSGVLGELFGFFWKAKLWWLIPILVVFVLLLLVILLAGSSPIAPFLYPLI